MSQKSSVPQAAKSNLHALMSDIQCIEPCLLPNPPLLRTRARGGKEFEGAYFDLICFMDCLHDLGDPVGALARCRKTLKPKGKVLLDVPHAGDRLEENLNPIGRV